MGECRSGLLRNTEVVLMLIEAQCMSGWAITSSLGGHLANEFRADRHKRLSCDLRKRSHRSTLFVTFPSGILCTLLWLWYLRPTDYPSMNFKSTPSRPNSPAQPDPSRVNPGPSRGLGTFEDVK
jgi:hypothetical protein